MVSNAGYVKPTMKQSLALFMSVLNFFKKNKIDEIDWREKTVHWDNCRKKGFNVPEKWYEHRPCTEDESFKFLWDFNIQTDNKMDHRRPDMIIIDKTSKKNPRIVDFAVPADQPFLNL